MNLGTQETLIKPMSKRYLGRQEATINPKLNFYLRLERGEFNFLVDRNKG